MPTTKSAARVLHASVFARYRQLRQTSFAATLPTASPCLPAIPFTNTFTPQTDFAKTGTAATVADVQWHKVPKMLVFAADKPSQVKQSACPPSAALVH